MDANLQIKLTAYALGELPAHEASTIEALLRVDSHAREVLAEAQDAIAGAETDLALPADLPQISDAEADGIIIEPRTPVAHPGPVRLAERSHLAIESEIQRVERGPHEPRNEARRRRRIDPEPNAWLPAGAAAAVLIAFGLTLLGLPGANFEASQADLIFADAQGTPATAAEADYAERREPANGASPERYAEFNAANSSNAKIHLASFSRSNPTWSHPIQWPDRPARAQYAQLLGRGWSGQSR